MGMLSITSGFYTSISKPVSHQECVNWYVHKIDTDTYVKEILIGTPGIRELLTTGELNQGNRGAHVKNDIPYFVNGKTLYRLNRVSTSTRSIYSVTSLGTVLGVGRVSMVDNGKQLLILAPDGYGYIYDESATPAFQQIADAGFTANGAPQYAVFIDGYFAVTTDSKKWIVSALNDGLSWWPLDFASAESDPDTIVAPIVIKNQIFITGSQTTEGYANIGGYDFPFQRNNLFLDKGCIAPFSLVKSNNSFFMIGRGVNENPAIWQFIDNEFIKISSNSIDILLSKYSDIELQTAHGWTYAQAGSYFIGFTLTDRAIVFDLSTLKWHERRSKINGFTTAWRASSIITAYGTVLVGDYLSGKIGELSLNEYQEYGSDIIRTVSIQPFTSERTEIIASRIELTMEAGVGSALCPNPMISMATSKDGKTWGYERRRAIGKVGAYGQRAIWRANGRFPKSVTLKFTLSDPVKPVIIKLEAA